MKNTLIVCTANKTRSPMAMEIANSIAAKRGLAYHFKSAGLAVIGVSLDENVYTVLKEIGIETDLTPTHIAELDIKSFDEIHVMTQRQKITLCAYFRDLDIASKVTVLGIDDPYGEGLDAYRACRDKLIAFYEGYIV